MQTLQRRDDEGRDFRGRIGQRAGGEKMSDDRGRGSAEIETAQGGVKGMQRA